MRIDLRGIILLEAEGKQNLLDFSEAGLLEINYADYLEEVTQVHRIRGISNVLYNSPLLWNTILYFRKSNLNHMHHLQAFL